MLYGGSIQFGEWKGKHLTIQDVFEAVGAYNAGKLPLADFQGIENNACPGAGACGGQFTANTMATAYEMLGVSPMGWNDVPATDTKKEEVAFECGRLVMELLRKGILPRSLVTRRRLRERHRRRHGHGRLDQRGAAPAGDRARGRRAAQARRFRSHREEDARCSPISSPGATTPPSRCTPPAAWPSSPSDCSRRGCSTRTRRR